MNIWRMQLLITPLFLIGFAVLDLAYNNPMTSIMKWCLFGWVCNNLLSQYLILRKDGVKLW